LAASGGTVLLAGNGEGDGQQCVFLTEDGNSMLQTNTNPEGMIALDDFGNSVGHIMPQQVSKMSNIIVKAKRSYLKVPRIGHYLFDTIAASPH